MGSKVVDKSISLMFEAKAKPPGMWCEGKSHGS
jgi:hypothetical protein